MHYKPLIALKHSWEINCPAKSLLIVNNRMDKYLCQWNILVIMLCIFCLIPVYTDFQENLKSHNCIMRLVVFIEFLNRVGGIWTNFGHHKSIFKQKNDVHFITGTILFAYN